MLDKTVRIVAVLGAITLGGCMVASGQRKDDRSDDYLTDDQPPVSAHISPGDGGPATNTITPVLFIPSDEQVEEATIDALKVGLADLEDWYQRELGDRRLRVGALAIVDGKHGSAHYLEDNRIWSEGPGELAEALGYSPWQEGHIVLLVGAGLMGWAGGSGNGSAGFAVLGLESLTGSERCAEHWWCTPTVWRGTAIHELGHALTLPHSEHPSIMSFHGDYLDKALIETEQWPEKSTVGALPFVEYLDGTPVVPDPEPATCEGGVPFGTTACDENDDSFEWVCAGGDTQWLAAPCAPGQACQDGHCQATTLGCKQYGTLEDCDAHGISCAWYACADRCMPKGTPLETACGCQYFTTLTSCDAAVTDGCAWYGCSTSCHPVGTPLELACP